MRWIFRNGTVTLIVCMLLVQHSAKPSGIGTGDGVIPMRPELPTKANTQTILSASPRHREWVNVPAAPTGIPAFIIHPERSDKAPVVIMNAIAEGPAIGFEL